MHACIRAHVYTYTGTHTCATPKKIKLKFLKEKNLHENAPKKVFISLLFQKGAVDDIKKAVVKGQPSLVCI